MRNIAILLEQLCLSGQAEDRAHGVEEVRQQQGEDRDDRCDNADDLERAEQVELAE